MAHPRFIQPIRPLPVGLKNRYLSALMNSEYKKNRSHFLRDYDGFCAIGVLLDLYDNTKWRQVEGRWIYGEHSTTLVHQDDCPLLTSPEQQMLIKAYRRSSHWGEVINVIRHTF